MMKRLQALAILCLMTVGLGGCTKRVPLHPGAISNLDSYAYDSLLIEQDVLNGAKQQFTSGQLTSAEFKHALNIAIQQYNTTETLWQNYHANGAGATDLQNALDALVTAIGQVQLLLGKKPVSAGPVSFRSPSPEDCIVFSGGSNQTWHSHLEHPCGNRPTLALVEAL